MFQIRIPVFIIQIILVVTTLSISVPAKANTAAITWYTGGEAKLNLTPIPMDSSSSIILAGTTTQKTLVIKVAKKGGLTRSNSVPVAADGSFNVRYLIKYGTGTYTITLFGSEHSNSLSYQGLGFFNHVVKKTLPADLIRLELNSKIIEFTNKAIGSTVGRGECWDLAQEALDHNLSDWARPTSFGILLNSKSDEIKAGDIIQFHTLKITEQLPGGVTKTETIGAPDHTAVIYNVRGKKQYTLAHQNVNGKRSVTTEDINLTKVTSGKYWIYRPVALMIQQ